MSLLGVTSLWPSFGTLAGATVLAPDLPTAIRERLEGTVTLAALAEVYKGKVRHPPSFPFLVISPLFTEPPTLNTSDTYYEPDFYQISAFSLDELEADRLADAAWAALSPLSTNSNLTFADGKMIWQDPGQRRHSQSVGNMGPGNSDVWRSSFDMVFWVQRLL